MCFNRKSNLAAIFGELLNDVINYAYGALLLKSGTFGAVLTVLRFIPSAVIIWVELTAAHALINRPPKSSPADEADNSEEKPFVEPYDFYSRATQKMYKI